MDCYLRERVSFGIETNLADVETWKSLLEIQKTGYYLHIIYISTNNLEVLNSRIQERYQLGGHFVRPDVVQERYLAGLKLLNHYSDKPDKLQLFDNSKVMELMAEINSGKVVYARKSLPLWITQNIKQIFNPRIKSKIEARDLRSIDEVRRRYLEGKKGEK